MELNCPHPRRPHRAEVGQAPLRPEAGQPRQQAQVHDHRRGLRPGRRRRAPASLAELGYDVHCFCYQDSPRRAHSIAAQGGINAAKNYQQRRRQRLPPVLRHGQGRRLPRPRGERLPPGPGLGEHHRPVRGPGRALRPRIRRARWTTAPSAAPRSRRTFYARGQTGQQLLLGAYQALERQVGLGKVKMFTRHEMLELVVVDGVATRHRHPRPDHRRDRVATWPTRWCWPPAATATSSTSPPTPRAATPRPSGAPTRRARRFANPCFTQIHPTCIPVTGDHQSKLTLMSESLRNDGRIWVPLKARATSAPPARSPRTSATTTWSASTLLRQPRPPRHRLAARPSRCATKAGAWATTGLGVYLDFAEAIERLGVAKIAREVRQPLRDVRAHHRRGPLQGAHAHLPGHPLHHGRAVGGLQPHDHHPRACSAWARPTSPTTAPTAWAPRP